MRTCALSYPSADGASTVRAWLWEPDERELNGRSRPRALVQIVHGMSEHAGRYLPFVEFLCAQGFAVCAHDHVGHGRTAAGANDLGHMPLRDGEDILVNDVQALRMQAIGRLGIKMPYVLFGHSMGSFIARVYLTRYAFGVRAAIICGTGQQPLIMTGAGRFLCCVMARLHGERRHSKLAHALGAGAFARSVKDARTDADWISTDADVVDAYLADPLSGQMFTVGAYGTLAQLATDAQRRRLAARIPHGLPMLFVAGADDPVGEYGRGVHRAVEEYRAAGVETVDEIIYPGARHEILNEPIAADVQRDILNWLERRGL
ncbi:alpha/beta fold hydrolase [Collinsella tanakaei]|uniref:alpha/beta fold hydrolase n=1 Tax=Collinsella tanakaei TaxID=626935 RepID=UPI00195EC68B|nr:alpha/beta fold hydrolase [Collinsella tanakaei]MBM6868029.1 alpha/beta fold hydrolase [Collinsella tanakaei]